MARWWFLFAGCAPSSAPGLVSVFAEADDGGFVLLGDSPLYYEESDFAFDGALPSDLRAFTVSFSSELDQNTHSAIEWRGPGGERVPIAVRRTVNRTEVVLVPDFVPVGAGQLLYFPDVIQTTAPERSLRQGILVRFDTVADTCAELGPTCSWR